MTAKKDYSYYDYARAWWNYSFENSDKVTASHCAVYMFAVEHRNRLGWKVKFGLPAQMVMDAVGIKSFHTYSKIFKDLVEWGMFTVIQKSVNQWSANIIALSNIDNALDKALDKAMTKHSTKHEQYNNTSIQEYKETIESDKPTTQKFIPPTVDEVRIYCTERKNKISPQKFIDHYEAVNWMRGKNKIKNWKAAVRTWEQNGIESQVEDKIFFDEDKAKDVVSAIEKMSATEWQTHMNVFRVNIESKMVYCESKKKYVTWNMIADSQRLFDRAKRDYESKGLGSTYLTPATYGKR